MPPRFFRWPTARDHVETALEEIASHVEYDKAAPGFLHRCAGDMRTRSPAHRRCGGFMVETEPVVFVGQWPDRPGCLLVTAPCARARDRRFRGEPSGLLVSPQR
jgi:hypothetical protein